MQSRLTGRFYLRRRGRFQAAFRAWDELLAASFLSPEKKSAYSALLAERKERLRL